MAGTLLLPFVVDSEGRLYSPEEAEKGNAYYCPSCGEKAILRRGSIKVPHFAPKESIVCNQETIMHKTAKLLIQKVIRDWKEGHARAPVIERECKVCWKRVNQPLPEKVDDAAVEYRFPDGFIADVALTAGGTVQAVVEIKVTHAIDEDKATGLTVPFVELDGNEVIRNPLLWKPINNRLRPVICKNCKSAWSRFQIKAKRISQATEIMLPITYYRYGIHKCWKCKRKILVFTWPEKLLFGDEKPGMNPVPRTIQYRYSDTVGHKYWANVCPYCNAIQGDFFLYMEPDGPFWGLSILYYGEDNKKDTPEAYRRDMLAIASHAAEVGLL